MPETILLIDAHFIAYRAHFSTGGPTGALYGFLRDIATLRERFSTDQLVFCFDHGDSLRKRDYPAYKAHRKPISADKQQSLNSLHRQIQLLKEELLAEMGFCQIFYADGYEGDDIIASVLKTNEVSNHKVMVSGDGDLYQLLDHDVSMYNPRTKAMMTNQQFRLDYQIRPSQWKHVKAIAGCSSDNIKGISGVGETTALKYLRNILKRSTRAAEKIRNGKEIWERNLRLVELPFLGCPPFKVGYQPPIDEKQWRKVTERFGMKSIRDKARRERELFDE